MNRNLREAVRDLPGDADAWFTIGQAAVAAGKSDEARYALLHSVELAPEDLQRAIDAGQLLAQAGCTSEGEGLFRRVLQVEPNFAPLRLELGRLLASVGDNAGARDEAERGLAVEPRDRDLLLLAGDANLRLGENLRAAELLRLILEQEPNHAEANRKLASLYAQLGDQANSILCWRRIAQPDLEALTGLGIALSQDGQHVEALDTLRRVVRLQEPVASAHANLGLALLAAGKLDDAVNALTRAQALDPGSAPAVCGLGLAYQRLARWPDAAQAFRTTEQLAPDNPTGPLNLALVLQAMGDVAGAHAALTRAAALAPADQEIEQALARTAALLTSVEQRRPVPPASSPAIDASIAGDLKSFSLFDVLELLRMQGKSGALVLSSRHGAGIVRLHAGAISSASAPGVPPLGQVIVAARLLTAAQLETALLQQRASASEPPEVLGALLLRESLIDDAQLTKVLFEQILEALGQISGWTEGGFSFHRDHAQSPPPVSFPAAQVLLEVVRRRDERQECEAREARMRASLARLGTDDV